MKIKKFGTTENRIYELVKPLADELSLYIWDVRFEKEGASFYLRVFIDKEGGITIEDCEDLTRPLNKLLDEVDPIPQHYILEVGSPGIERDLLRENHYEICLGEPVRVRFIRTVDDNKEFIGCLVSWDKDKITIEIEGEQKEFSLSDIAFVRIYDDEL